MFFRKNTLSLPANNKRRTPKIHKRVGLMRKMFLIMAKLNLFERKVLKSSIL